MFGAFSVDDTAFAIQMADKVMALHLAILQRGFFFSGFHRWLSGLSTHAGFPV